MSFPSAAAKSAPAFSRLKTLLLFLALGPPVGGILTFLAIVIYAHSENGNFSMPEAREILAGFGLLLFVLITSYLSALIPAGLTGFIVGRTTGVGLNGLPRDLVFFAAIGAAITMAYTACLLGIKMGADGPMSLISFISIVAILAIPGAVAAMICGYIALRAGWLTPPTEAKDLAN